MSVWPSLRHTIAGSGHGSTLIQEPRPVNSRRPGRCRDAVLSPPPVVVDADVLIRNVEYAARRGYVGALTRHVSTRYSMMTGVVPLRLRRDGCGGRPPLADIADRRHVEIDDVGRVLRAAIRFVDVPERIIDDPRIEGTNPKDRHTARLACFLAPAVLATDNRTHFKPSGLADAKTDAVAIDLAALEYRPLQSRRSSPDGATSALDCGNPARTRPRPPIASTTRRRRRHAGFSREGEPGPSSRAQLGPTAPLDELQQCRRRWL